MKDETGEENEARKGEFSFRLYVTGASPNSSKAITNFKNICETYLKDNYELDVIDVYQQPEIALSVDIIALPLLIRVLPLPQQRLVGDMSNSAKIINALSISVPD